MLYLVKKQTYKIKNLDNEEKQMRISFKVLTLSLPLKFQKFHTWIFFSPSVGLPHQLGGVVQRRLWVKPTLPRAAAPSTKNAIVVNVGVDSRRRRHRRR